MIKLRISILRGGDYPGLLKGNHKSPYKREAKENVTQKRRWPCDRN